MLDIDEINHASMGDDKTKSCIADPVEDIASTLTHDELLEITQSSLYTLTKCDSLLSDLPSDIILDEILSQIAVEHGQAITLFISREDEPVLKVIVPQNASVRNLKKAVAKHFEIYQKRTQSKVKISWKYIWKTYNLCYDSTVLENDDDCIQYYGVVNKITLQFKKKRRDKTKSK